jgi:hypothetical protein
MRIPIAPVELTMVTVVRAAASFMMFWVLRAISAVDSIQSKVRQRLRLLKYKVEQYIALRYYRWLIKKRTRELLVKFEGKELEHLKEQCSFMESHLYGNNIELRESGARLVYWNAWLEVEDEVYKMMLRRKGIEDPGTSLFFVETRK